MTIGSESRCWIAQSPEGIVAFERGIDEVSAWATHYLESLGDRDVCPQIQWGEVLERMDESPPTRGAGIEAIGDLIGEADSVFVERLVHWTSPRFFAYFPCSNSIPAILGELMSAVVNVNGMLWSSSPACTELEMRVMDWCAELFGLDEGLTFGRSERGGGCIQGTASEAVVAAMTASRRRCTRRGIDRSLVTVYTSDQAHSSTIKAAMICGLADDAEDRSRVRVIESDAGLGMDVRALERAMTEDIERGLVPMMVVATVGSTSTGAVDSIDRIGSLIGMMGGEKPWLHVDAAWAGAAAVCPEFRWLLDGIDRADSVCINPHKWLLTNFDCDLFFVRDRDALIESMSITPEYLREKSVGSEVTGIVDYRDWHVALGRRMRALKLWMVIRCFGIDGLRAHIRNHIELAERFERWIIREARLELVCGRMLGLVCFVVAENEYLTARLVERVNQRGRVMITHSRVPIGPDRSMRSIARVSVGSPGVQEEDIDVLISEISLVLGELELVS